MNLKNTSIVNYRRTNSAYKMEYFEFYHYYFVSAIYIDTVIVLTPELFELLEKKKIFSFLNPSLNTPDCCVLENQIFTQ